MERTRRLVDRVARGVTPRRTDTVLAVGLTLLGVAELLFEAFDVSGVASDEGRPWLLSLLVGLIPTIAVAWRRRAPVAAAAIALGTTGAVSLLAWAVNGQDPGNRLLVLGGIASLVLLYSVVRYADGVARLLICTGMVAGSLLDELASGPGMPYGALVSTIIFVAGLAGVAVAFRYRADLREERTAQARTGEREQLARELHDVVAHHVSAMVVQASAALAVLDQQPEAARPALQFIKSSGQATMGEMRQMVGILRGSEPAELAPRQGIAGLAEVLVDVPGAAPVRLHEAGARRTVDVSVDQSVLRIVQEAVTNARRHGRATTAVDVSLGWRHDGLDVCIDNDGAPAPIGPADRGYGLIGMAERARLVGGTFTAGPRPGGGWRVQATFPLEPVDAPDRSERPEVPA